LLPARRRRRSQPADDLAGQEVFTRRKSRYWLSLERLNEQFKASGKPAMTLKEADENLEDEDILNIVGTGGAGHHRDGRSRRRPLGKGF
jgi:hypothetical protein